jgi:general secretion pathway protein G
MIRRTVRKAFTLVEILIVVVILGILAAIVVPQFTNATQDAQAGNLKAQLSSLNRQLELYRAKNNGTLPGVATLWNDLIVQSYIKDVPSNPAFPVAADKSTVIAAEATGDVGGGWVLTTAGAGTPGTAGYIPPYTLFASYFDEVTGLITPTTP